jgi:hypothetical protein
MTRNGVANNDGGAEPRQRDTPGILGADPVIPPGEGGGTITSPSILACQCKDGMFSKLHKTLDNKLVYTAGGLQEWGKHGMISPEMSAFSLSLSSRHSAPFKCWG